MEISEAGTESAGEPEAAPLDKLLDQMVSEALVAEPLPDGAYSGSLGAPHIVRLKRH